MSETSTRFALPISSGRSFERMNWKVGYLIDVDVLALAGEQYERLRRQDIAARIPPAEDLDLLVGDAPREWLAEDSWK